MAIGKIAAIKTFFSTPEKPVTVAELTELRREDRDGFDEKSDRIVYPCGGCAFARRDCVWW